MLTKSTADATARQAHRYNGTRRADSLPFAGSKFRPETTDQKQQTHHPLYKELSDLTESTSLTVTKVLQSLIPLTP